MNHILSQEALLEAVRKMEPSSWAAVDTEADSLHHYIEKLCLVQITDENGDWIVDPLVPLDISQLLQMLEKKLLILHGADFDVRTLKKSAPFNPVKIFDTMLAAQILGYERFGLADLAEKICGIRLSKAAQTADWAERPLKAYMLEYAANDTHYLYTIYSKMKQELAELGRTDWHEESCARLLDSLQEKREERTDRHLDWQIKGSKDLSPKALTFLKEFWNWRDGEARRLDRPTFKVMNGEYLLQMSVWAENNPGKDISEWKEAPRQIRSVYRDAINPILRRAESLPPTPYTHGDKIKKFGKKLSGPDQDLIGKLKEARTALAAELKIQASVLLTNYVLENMVRKSPKNLDDLLATEGIMKWQARTLAPVFLPIFSS